MKTQGHPIDDFFRKGLQDHTITPSTEAKNAFLKEAVKIKGIRRTIPGWVYIATILLIGVIGGTAVFLRSYRSPQIPEVNSSGKTIASSSSVIPRELNQITSSLHPSSRRDSLSRSKRQQSTGRKEASLIKSPLSDVSSSPGKMVVTSPDTTTTQSFGNERRERIPVITMINHEFYGFPLSVKTDTIPEYTSLQTPSSATSREIIPEINNTKSSGWNFSSGISYSPEWLFNTPGGTKYVNNLGIEQTFRFRKYSLRTGLGISVTKRTDDLFISYNDWLGTFRRLDSITFTWDQGHTHAVPTYHFSDQQVWDSLMEQQSTRIIRRYTYLQIPLILGYDFWSGEHFSFGLRLGPVLSVQLASKQVSEAFDPGNNKIIMINQTTSDWIETNCQLMGGINAVYHISRRFDLELEPDARYYFNPAHKKSGITGTPWSLGLRVAITIKY